ncbi:hypothetical protein H4R34_006197, partial [Dimargaris verticillata]
MSAIGGQSSRLSGRMPVRSGLLLARLCRAIRPIPHCIRRTPRDWRLFAAIGTPKPWLCSARQRYTTGSPAHHGSASFTDDSAPRLLEIHVETVDQDPESRATRVERLARLTQAPTSHNTSPCTFRCTKRFFVVPYQDHRHAISDRLALHKLLSKDASTLPRGLQAMIMPSQP